MRTGDSWIDAADGLRVLLVEDDPVLAGGYQMKLELDGYQVEVSGDGTTALRMAAADPPDLMFLDERLRRTEAGDLVEALRTEQRTRLVPVVVLTASGGPSADGAREEAGRLNYLVIARDAFRVSNPLLAR